MIRIKKSPTADTRTCDFSKVTRETLLTSSIQHIFDVQQGLGFFSKLLRLAADEHDHDKVSDIEGFHRDFLTGFKETKWWDNHRLVNRHHLNNFDGVPEDVNLVDVIEYVTDCVMAGMARSGNLTPITLESEVLQRAMANTIALLKANIAVI